MSLKKVYEKDDPEKFDEIRRGFARSLRDQQLRTDDIKLNWLQEFVKLKALICSTGVGGALVILQQTEVGPTSAVRWALILFLVGLVLSALVMFHVMNAYANKGYEIWQRRSDEIFKAKNTDQLNELARPLGSQYKPMASAGIAIGVGWLCAIIAIGLLIGQYW